MRPATLAACVLSAAFCSSQQVRKPAASSPQPAARAHYERAGEMARKGDLDGAITEYRAALKVSPSYADAHFFLSVVLAKKGDEKDAINELRETIRLNPNHSDAHQFLGSTLQHSVARDIISHTQISKSDTRLDEAIKEDRIAVRLKPESAQTHYWLGSALELRL